MRSSTVVWAIFVAAAIAVAIMVSACAGPPTNDPAVGLNWDEGTWDSYTWK
jgi:hypothetical protein